MGEQIYFVQDDYQNFRQWINLNWEGVTWQGKFEKEFNQFWQMFFLDGLSLAQLMERYDYARRVIKNGPLHSWFGWLKEKFLVYCFVYKDLDLQGLASLADLEIKEVALILRNFFSEKVPESSETFNQLFLIGHGLGEVHFLSFKKMMDLLGPSLEIKSGGGDDEVMISLEVTLYKEWAPFIKNFSKHYLLRPMDLKKIKDRASFKFQRQFLQEVILLLLIGGGLIYSLKTVNQWYEDFLAKKITILEPDFFWLNKKLLFKEMREETKGVEVQIKDIQRPENVDVESTPEAGEEWFAPETDVIITSIDSLPPDFEKADQEHSEYEEVEKGGYRDDLFGNKKVYRVMVKSVDIPFTVKKISNLLEKYEATQVDNVRPGTSVPGGIYYNLYIPSQFLKEFLADVDAVEDAILYVSRTQSSSPPGKSKVFVWVKEI